MDSGPGAGNALADTYKAHGEAQYRQGDYFAALIEFSKAIEAGDGDRIALLDARCGTYQKLDQHDSALREARKIMRLAPTDPRGYLRAGMLLVLTKKHANAYDIYTRGLLNVIPSNPKRKIIQEQAQKLEAAIKPRKKRLVDPFTRLPTETASAVLQSLDFYSIVTCLRVSKEWNKLLVSLPQLWRTVDFSCARRLVSVSQVRASIRQTNAKCRKVVLKRVSDPGCILLNEVMIRCPSLEYFESNIGLRAKGIMPLALPGSQKLKTLILSGTPSSIRDVQQLVSQCPNLERAEFHSILGDERVQWTTPLEKLKVLKLDGHKHWHTLLPLEKMLATAPNLEELYLGNLNVSGIDGDRDILNTSKVPSLRRLGLDNCLTQLLSLPSSLEELEIVCCTPGSWIQNSDSSTEFKDLKALKLPHGDKALTSWLDAVMEKSTGEIERLDLTGCVHLEKARLSLHMTRAKFDKLKELYLPSVDVDDAVISEFLIFARSLEIIDLSHTAITGITVKKLVQTQDELRKIIVRQCSNVGLDAVEFARCRGIKVDNSNPDDKKRKKGRKIWA